MLIRMVENSNWLSHNVHLHRGDIIGVVEVKYFSGFYVYYHDNEHRCLIPCEEAEPLDKDWDNRTPLSVK